MPEEQKKKRGRPPLPPEEKERRRRERSRQNAKNKRAAGYKPLTPPPPPFDPDGKNGGIGVEPDFTIRRVADLMRTGLRVERVDVKDPEALLQRAEGFIEYCRENGIVPTMAGVCAAMGIGRHYYNELMKGSERVRSSQEVRDTLERIKEVIGAGFQACACAGEVTNVVAVLIMTNEYGYLDTKKIEHTREISVQVEAVSDLQKLQQKYGTSALVADNHIIETNCIPIELNKPSPADDAETVVADEMPEMPEIPLDSPI